MCLVIKVLPHPNQTVKSSESSRQAGKMALPLQAPVPTTWSTWKKLTQKLPPHCSKGGINSGSLPKKVCMYVHMDPLWY